MLRRNCILTLIVLLLVVSSETFAQSSSPTFYYYSDVASQLVIESADASARTTLFDFSISNEKRFVGPGWDSGNRFFVWTTKNISSRSQENVYIYDSEANETNVLLEDEYIVAIDWSFVGNKLSIIYQTEALEAFLVLYDPNQGIYLHANFANLGIQSPGAPYTLRWSPDSLNMLLHAGSEVIVLDADGNKLIEQETLRTPLDCSFGVIPTWVKENRFAYISDSGSILNIFSLESYSNYSMTISEQILYIDFSQNDDFAGIYTQINGNKNLWLLSIETMESSLVAQDVDYSGNCNAPLNETLWNDNDELLFINSDLNLSIVNATGKPTQLEIASNASFFTSGSLRWNNNGDVIYLVQTTDPIGKQIYVYDHESNETQLLYPMNANAVIVTEYLSPLSNGRFIFNAISLIDTTSATKFIEIENTPNPETILVRDTLWHPDGNWMFIQLDFGTSSTNHPVYLLDVDRNTARLITSCVHLQSACVGWVNSIPIED